MRRGEHVGSSDPARKIEAWRDTATNVETGHQVLNAVLRQTESDLGALLIHDDTGRGRAFVAAGAPWFMTLFGRDSLLTAWMALPLHVGLSIGTLQQLASVQGRRVDPITEEQPGRIMHEIRRGPASADVLGGSIYYGSVDATPLFVMLLAECWRWGADEAAVRALLPAADAALAWAENHGDRDGDGFVEYHRATDRGLINQGWKDSFDGINDAAGHTAEPPIALCEVQGYQYAALLARAELADGFGDATAAARLRDRADTLRGKFLDAFWLPEKGWYAIALDGSKRHVDALTSNVGHCLWTGIATDEHAEQLIERLAASGDGLRVRVAHARDDDGRLQPDELPQRLGMAARHRDRGGRSAALPPRAGRGGTRRAAGDRHAGRGQGVRRPAARAILRLPALPVPLAGALPDVVLTAGLGQRRAAAADAVVPRPESARAAPHPVSVAATAQGVGQDRADRSAARWRDRARTSRG